MKLNEKSLALLLLCPAIRADDKSCYEDGKWQGDEIEPDGSTSYPEEKKAWDLSDEDYDSQPGICENIRIIMGGVDWTMNREDEKAECKVLSSVTGSEEKDDNIRSIECTDPPTYTPSASPTPGPTWNPTETPTESPTPPPTVSPTTSPTKMPSSSSSNPTSTPTRTPSSTPSLVPTPSPNAAPLNAGSIEHQTLWYYIVCAILLALLCCLMVVAYCWMVDRENYIEKKHAKAMDIIEALRKRMSKHEREPSEGVQMGPNNYSKQVSHYKGYRMNSAARSSTSSVFSNRSSRLQLSTGRTMWRGSIDDCSMDDEEAIYRRFSTNPPMREPSEMGGQSYSESQVEMMATPPGGSGRLLTRGYMGAKQNRSPGVNENPNLNTFNINKALKTGVVKKGGSFSHEENNPYTPDDIYGDKTGLLVSTEDTSPLVNVNSPGSNSEPSASFTTPEDVEIEVKIFKQEAPIPEGKEEEEEDEDEFEQRGSKTWTI